MIGVIEDAIIDRIKTADLGYKLKKVASYGGEFADALDRAVTAFPCILVAFAGKTRADSHNMTTRFLIMCCAENLRNERNARRGDGTAAGSYQMVKDIETLFHRRKLGLEAVDEITVTNVTPLVNDKSGSRLASVYGVELSMRVADEDGVEDSSLGEFETFHANWDVPPLGNVSTDLPADETADATDHVTGLYGEEQ